jgi:hypothetical protein
LHEFFEQHPNSLRILIIVGIFTVGCIEDIAKLRSVARTTWALGLCALIAWIVYPLTVIRIYIGAIVLTSGVGFLIGHYRKRK